MGATKEPQKNAPSPSQHVDQRLIDTAAIRNGLERRSRSLWGVRKEAAPSMIGKMIEDKEALEMKLIRRIQELAGNLESSLSEQRRCKHNLEVLQQQGANIQNSEAKEKFDRALAAQEAQLQRAGRQWTEILDTICQSAVDLQWSHGVPARRPDLNAVAAGIRPDAKVAPPPGVSGAMAMSGLGNL